MFGVSLNGLGKPNPNRVVRPFEPENIGLAAMVGLWMLPPGFYMLTSPLRLARRLKRTRYALTDYRAIIVEPGFFGRTRVRSYPPESLRLMRSDEQPDGSGDLIFEERIDRWQHDRYGIGFLAIDDVQRGRVPGPRDARTGWVSVTGPAAGLPHE